MFRHPHHSPLITYHLSLVTHHSTLILLDVLAHVFHGSDEGRGRGQVWQISARRGRTRRLRTPATPQRLRKDRESQQQEPELVKSPHVRRLFFGQQKGVLAVLSGTETGRLQGR